MARQTMSSRMQALLERNAGALTAASRVPLLARMADGSIDAGTFGRYLAIERAFVHDAAHALGFCIAAEAEWDATVRFAQALEGLVGEQSEYFAANAPVDGPVSPGSDTAPPGVDALRVTVRAAMEAGYPAVVTCMCAAETLYSTWCGEVEHPTGRAAEWIALHTTDTFRGQVAFLQSRVDRIPRDQVSDDVLDHWFTSMLAAENRFHAAAAHENLEEQS